MPGISVIVAGATGSTGGELVSKLVSHRDVSRVVALSRTEISVDKWSSYFPNLKQTDALKYLSVVSVDWDRIYRDSRGVPAALLCSNSSRAETVDERQSSEFELNEMLRELNEGHAVELSSSHRAGLSIKKKSPSRTGGYHVDRIQMSRVPDLPLMITASQKSSVMSLLHDPYYRSIFSGHHVAINCLGSHRFWFSAAHVDVVDHQYSIAFAKFIRLFSASEVTTSLLEDASSISSLVTRSPEFRTKLRNSTTREAVVNTLMELSPRKDSDSPLPPFDSYGLGGYIPRVLPGTLEWDEVRSACFGVPVDSDHLAECDSTMERLKRGRRHAEHTLHHFIQVSTAGASMSNPVPYFKVHGLCDDRLVHLFDHQFADEEPTEGKRHVPDMTIFRPGLIHRRKARWVESVLSFVMPPIPVETFADIILDDLFAKRAAHKDATRDKRGDRCLECSARVASKSTPTLDVVNSFDIFSRSHSRSAK